LRNDSVLSHGNGTNLLPTDTETIFQYLNRIQVNFTENLQAEVDITLAELKGILLDGQGTMQSTVNQVRAKLAIRLQIHRALVLDFSMYVVFSSIFVEKGHTRHAFITSF